MRQMAEAPFDLVRAHRWFAVELNNYAWGLLEQPNLTAEQTERLIHAAHASIHHWLHAGDQLNHLRGQVLLANAYAVAGLSEGALRHAKHAIDLDVASAEKRTPFDHASVLACAARAFQVAGAADESSSFNRAAREAAGELDEDERKVLEGLLALID